MSRVLEGQRGEPKWKESKTTWTAHVITTTVGSAPGTCTVVVLSRSMSSSLHPIAMDHPGADSLVILPQCHAEMRPLMVNVYYLYISLYFK